MNLKKLIEHRIRLLLRKDSSVEETSNAIFILAHEFDKVLFQALFHVRRLRQNLTGQQRR